MPLTIFLLLVSVGSLGYKAQNRRGYYPLTIGLIASFAIVIGKFYLDNNFVVYVGVTSLIGASIWNVWPRRNTKHLIGIRSEYLNKKIE